MSLKPTPPIEFLRKLVLPFFIILVVATLNLANQNKHASDPSTWGPDARHRTNSIGMRFVLIQPGNFIMGSASTKASDHEKPAHAVTISRAFFIAAAEVTQAQWKAVMGSNPSRFQGDDLPVEQVSWDDAQEFLRKLNTKEQTARYRLPTEAEWEYACRAGATEDHDADFESVAWYDPGSEGRTHHVAQKQRNAWGLNDMLGNVYEWCEDWKGPYPSEHATDPEGPSAGSYRVVRGGSWYVHANRTRPDFRDFFTQGTRRDDIGFRVVAVARIP